MSRARFTGPHPYSLLGSMLGIDFCRAKACWVHCVYCGVGMRATRKTLQREMVHPADSRLRESARTTWADVLIRFFLLSA